ncbi:hypothetical protein BD309DRAFT_970225 [Dichomitus squalens]|uniref:Uncharacterized protein n=1 Tax=Dichomitus squalens TaxID=114155 RepID=A0A4Q9PBS7_9APHY|nr:hypothetical protein BD309DRAFT_970225 [Dichomitus squalens]TBU52214.1 hypothetical protein BD310DRAFT_940751 [Dichomitus squalens]
MKVAISPLTSSIPRAPRRSGRTLASTTRSFAASPLAVLGILFIECSYVVSRFRVKKG